MSLPLILRPEAEQDIAEARDWYEQHRDGLGSEFLDEVEACFARIRQFPEAYAAGYRGVRPPQKRDGSPTWRTIASEAKSSKCLRSCTEVGMSANGGQESRGLSATSE